MADRGFIDKSYSLLKGETRIYCAVTVGAAGAVTLVDWNYPGLAPQAAVARTYSAAPTTGGLASWPFQTFQGSEGVFSVARTGAGLWTVTFQNAYQRMVGMRVYCSLAGGLSAIVQVAENTTISNFTSGAQAVVGVALLSATATALDPANGERVNLAFTFQNSTAS